MGKTRAKQRRILPIQVLCFRSPPVTAMKLCRMFILMLPAFVTVLLLAALSLPVDAENDESELNLYLHGDVDPDSNQRGSIDTHEPTGTEIRHQVWNAQNPPQRGQERHAGTWEYELNGDFTSSGTPFHFRIWGEDGVDNGPTPEPNLITIRSRLLINGNQVFEASDTENVGTDEVLFEMTAGDQSFSGAAGDTLSIELYCTWSNDPPDTTGPDDFKIIYDGAGYEAGGNLTALFVSLPSQEAQGEEHNDEEYILISAVVQAAFGNDEMDPGGYYIKINEVSGEDTDSPDISTVTYDGKEAQRISWQWDYGSTPDGDYTAHVRCRDRYGNLWGVDTSEFTVEKSGTQDYGVTIDVNVQNTEVAPDESAEFTLTVKNTGNGKDSFTLDLSGIPEKWNYAFDPDRYVEDLGAGETEDVTLYITPPDKNKIEVSEADITVRVASDGNENADADLVVSVSVIYYDVEINLNTISGDTSPVVPAEFTLRIHNTGSVGERFAIQVTEGDTSLWEVKILTITGSPSEYINSGKYKDVTIEVYSPDQAERGDNEDFTILVASQEDPTAARTASFSVEVKYGIKLEEQGNNPTKVDAGKTLRLNALLRNTYGRTVDLRLRHMKDDYTGKWKVALKQESGSSAESVSMDPDSSMDILIEVKIPKSAGGNYELSIDVVEDLSERRAVEEPLVFSFKVNKEEDTGILGSSAEEDRIYFGLMGTLVAAIVGVVGLKKAAAGKRKAAVESGTLEDEEEEYPEKEKTGDREEGEKDEPLVVTPVEAPVVGAEDDVDIVDVPDVEDDVPGAPSPAPTASPAAAPAGGFTSAAFARPAPPSGRPGSPPKPGALPYRQGRGIRPAAGPPVGYPGMGPGAQGGPYPVRSGTPRPPYESGPPYQRPYAPGSHPPWGVPRAPIPVHELEDITPVPVHEIEDAGSHGPYGRYDPARVSPGARPSVEPPVPPGAPSAPDAAVEVELEEDYAEAAEIVEEEGGGRFGLGGRKGKKGRKKVKRPGKEKPRKEKKTGKGKAKKDGKMKKGRKGKRGKKGRKGAAPGDGEYPEEGAAGEEYAVEAVVEEDYGVEAVLADEEVVVAEDEVVVEEY